MGCLLARRRPARADSWPVRILALAVIGAPVGRPRLVQGAMVTSGLFRMRFTFPALSQLRMKARSPSTAMLTGVLTGVPSRRNVVNRTVPCRAKGANDAADAGTTSAVACCFGIGCSVCIATVRPAGTRPSSGVPICKEDDRSGRCVTSSSENAVRAQPAPYADRRLLAAMRCPGEDALLRIQDGRWVRADSQSRKETVWGRRSTNVKSTGTTG